MALSRRQKLFLSLPVALPTLLVIAWYVFTFHRPWRVPAEHQPPASWLVPVQPGNGLTLKYLGVSGYEVTDGTTTVLMDPTPTRPTPTALITGPIDADPKLGEAMCPKATVILVNHSHHDHVIDVPAIALRTGALVVGSQNTVNLAIARGVPASQTRVVKSGDSFTVGTFTIDVRSSRHTDILVEQPMSGVIATDAKDLWFFQYALDDTFAYRLTAAGTTLWFHPTSTYATGELGGLTAPTMIVGVTGEKQTPEKVKGLLAEGKFKRVIPTHYDNFFQPSAKGLALMPGLNLDAVKRVFLEQDPSLEWGVLEYDQAIALPPDAPAALTGDPFAQ